jgi:hypothetical protein
MNYSEAQYVPISSESCGRSTFDKGTRTRGIAVVCSHVQKSRKGTSAGSLFPQIHVKCRRHFIFTCLWTELRRDNETIELANGHDLNGKTAVT